MTSNEGSRRKKERLARGMTRLRYNRLQSAIWAIDSRYTSNEGGKDGDITLIDDIGQLLEDMHTHAYVIILLVW